MIPRMVLADATSPWQLWRVLLLCLWCHHVSSALVSNDDWKVMKELKDKYRDQVDLSSWTSDSDCSTWKNVDCDGDRVAAIYFQGTWLGGPFPSVVTKLSALRKWYSDGNNFTGVFPTGFSTLSKLQVLRLSGNLLQGPLPAGLGNLPSLYKFYVKENRYLTGTIPPSWANLNLQEAYFDSNSFSGPLPTVFCNWTSLQRIRLGGNQWYGNIPDCVTKLNDLVNLYMDGLGLSGTIPPGIGALTDLELLVLGGNNLTGPIPPSIGNLRKLNTLFLSANDLTGPLPAGIGNLTNLVSFTMEFNSIDGPIPTEMGLMSKVQRILLDNNKLYGPIPDSLGNLQDLTMLLLQGNSLSGVVPTSIASGCKSLQFLNLESNWLTGPPPTGFASTKMQQINIRANFFVGAAEYRTSTGKLICPKLEINDWQHSSSMYNCLSEKSPCGPTYDEQQRPKGVCKSFCSALGPKGACRGKGVCSFKVVKKQRRAICTCFKGFRKSRDGLKCLKR